MKTVRFDVWRLESGHIAIERNRGVSGAFGVFNFEGMVNMNLLGWVESDSRVGAYAKWVAEHPEDVPMPAGICNRKRCQVWDCPAEGYPPITLIGGYIIVGLILAGMFGGFAFGLGWMFH